MPNKFGAGCRCCPPLTCPIADLSDKADWTINSGTLTENPSGGIDWMNLNGTIEPASPISGVEAYTVHLGFEGSATLTVEGEAITIDTAAGTIAVGGVSSPIPPDSGMDSSKPGTFVIVRATPSYISVYTSASIEYGSGSFIDAVGSVLTKDRTGSVTIDIELTMTSGRFYGKKMESSEVIYSYGARIHYCPVPAPPKCWRVVNNLFNDDPSTYMPLLAPNFEDWFPKLVFDEDRTRPSSGTCTFVSFDSPIGLTPLLSNGGKYATDTANPDSGNNGCIGPPRFDNNSPYPPVNWIGYAEKATPLDGVLLPYCGFKDGFARFFATYTDDLTSHTGKGLTSAAGGEPIHAHGGYNPEDDSAAEPYQKPTFTTEFGDINDFDEDTVAVNTLAPGLTIVYDNIDGDVDWVL